MPDCVIEPRPSTRLRAAGVTLHLLAAVAVWACDLPPVVPLVLSAFIAFSLIRLLYRPVGRFRRMERYGERWSLFSEQGTIHEGILSHWFVHPRLLVLVFRTGRWRRAVVALPDDAAGADALRRLRRHLLDRQRMDEVEHPTPGA